MERVYTQNQWFESPCALHFGIDMYAREAFSKIIKEKRKSAGNTQEEIAIATGINRVTYARIEKGQKICVHIESMEKIFNVLGITWDEYAKEINRLRPKCFIGEDEFNILGRGKVITTTIEFEDDLPALGEIVVINNKFYEVLGIERFMKLLSTPIPSKNVGLLVKEVAQ